MKKLFILILFLFIIQSTTAFEKKSIVERFTNTSCPPCATINNAWYNSVTADLINSNTISHIIYNVYWPSSSDPMYVFNIDENNAKISYYNVNVVPTIVVNGSIISTSESALVTSVNSGNADYSPFKILLNPIYFSSNILRVNVKIIRDADDNTNPEDLRLRVAITEKSISYTSPPGSNGESEFFSVCRKMLPDDTGTSFETPAKGDSSEFLLEFIPNEEFISTVDVNNLRIAAFLQNNTSKEIIQSEMEDVVFVSQLEALFEVAEHIGVPPFSVTFSNYSTSTDSTSITKYEWDFNNDGVVDSEEQEPTWVFTEEGSYAVSLTVKDGIEEYTRMTPNFIHVLGNTSNILVVNGINYTEYENEMSNFYANSVCFAGNEVDVWDLYGVQDFNFNSNEKVKRTHLFSQHIPTEVLNLYEKIIWIGDHHMGDTQAEMGDQIVEYVSQGGNFLLSTNNTKDFFNDNLQDYCGVSRFSPNSSVGGITAVDPNLTDLNVSTMNTVIQFARLEDSSKAVPIFTRIGSDSWIAGFTLHKTEGAGGFIYLGGSAYLYDAASATQNFDYIIENWLRIDPAVGIGTFSDKSLSSEFMLHQNYPNPFNPSTIIKFRVPNLNSVNGTNIKLKIFDIVGKEIKTLVNENKQPGNYEIEFDGANLSSGIYYYQLISNNFIETKKMILLK